MYRVIKIQENGVYHIFATFDSYEKALECEHNLNKHYGNEKQEFAIDYSN